MKKLIFLTFFLFFAVAMFAQTYVSADTSVTYTDTTVINVKIDTVKNLYFFEMKAYNSAGEVMGGNSYESGWVKKPVIRAIFLRYIEDINNRKAKLKKVYDQEVAKETYVKDVWRNAIK